MKKLLLLILLFTLLMKHDCSATHNRGGEITYTHVSGLTYEITITTYTNSFSAADRPSLDSVHLGDGTTDVFLRMSYQDIAGNVRVNKYVNQHMYSAPGSYRIYFVDPNRNEGVINMPFSISEGFCIETWLVAFDPSQYCVDNSPVFSEIPLYRCQAGRKYLHNIAAYDADMDSLSYQMVSCLGNGATSISGYYVPSGFSIDAVTGQMKWLTPDTGTSYEYQFAVRVNEWRHGNMIGYVERDFQVIVYKDVDTTNHFMPLIFSQDTSGNYYITKNEGDTLSFVVKYVEPAGSATFGAAGEAFSLSSPPSANYSVYGDTLKQSFQWIIDTAKGREEPYNFVLRGRNSTRDMELAVTVYVNGILADSCPPFPFPVSVSEIKKNEQSVTCYPNPNHGTFSLNISGGCRVVIYNLPGGEVYHAYLNRSNQSIETMLEPGLYFVRANNEKGEWVGKVVVE
jgi:hypothetical protein